MEEETLWNKNDLRLREIQAVGESYQKMRKA